MQHLAVLAFVLCDNGKAICMFCSTNSRALLSVALKFHIENPQKFFTFEFATLVIVPYFLQHHTFYFMTWNFSGTA